MMSIFQIALNNLKRRKVKMSFLMMGLVVGIATVVAFINIIAAMHLELGDRIDEFGANALIMPRFEGIEGHFGNDITFDVQTITMEDIPKIFQSSVAEYINIVSPKLVGAVNVGTKKSLIVGVEPNRKFAQKPWFSLKEYIGVQRGNEVVDLALLDLADDYVILGNNAAMALDLTVGDDFFINNQPFKVFGILQRLGSEEDGLIIANLHVVQGLLNRPGELSMIEVSAYCNFCPIEEVAMGLEEALKNSRVIPLRQAAIFRYETIGNFSAFGYALSGLVMVVAALLVLTTMLSAVNERTREIGILRAIGFRKAHIIKIILLEVGFVSLLGGLLGFFLGSFFAQFTGPYLAQLQGDIAIRMDLLLPAIILSTSMAMLVSIYPALKSAKLDPAEALRFI